MNLNKLLLFVLIFANIYCASNENRTSYLKGLFSHMYLKNILMTTLGISAIGLMIYQYAQIMMFRYRNISLNRKFLKYLDNDPQNIKQLREKQKKAKEKGKIFAQETLKDMQKKVLEQKVDPRPFVLSGNLEEQIKPTEQQIYLTIL